MLNNTVLLGHITHLDKKTPLFLRKPSADNIFIIGMKYAFIIGYGSLAMKHPLTRYTTYNNKCPKED